MTEPVTFLNSRVSVRQAEGYRAGLDAVLLASAVSLKPGQRALELGCGAGTALLCAAYLNPQVSFTGLEKHRDILGLAQENVDKNTMQEQVTLIEGSVLSPPKHLRPDHFDAVFLNPPFFDDPEALRTPKPGKDSAFISDGAKLKDWISTALRLTRARGHITLIQRADRLGDCLAAFNGRAGDIRILPLIPRAGEAAHRIIIRARRNVKTPLRLLSPLVIHAKGRGWTPKTEAILLGEARIDLTPPG
jgi:tRNA1(Val) A37 N6-methylase TrmN6